MYVSEIRHRVLPQCRIVLSNAEKSLQGRANKARELSSRLQKKMLAKRDVVLTVKDLKKELFSFEELKNTHLDIYGLQSESYKACMRTLFDAELTSDDEHLADINYHGFMMEFKTDEKGNIENPYGDIVHESRHLFDNLCFPKTMILANFQDYFFGDGGDKFNELTNFVMDPNVYKPKKVLGLFKKHTFEAELKEKLKDVENYKAIKILQKTRYLVQTEINAYGDYIKYYAKQIHEFPNLLFKIPKFAKGIIDEFEFFEKKRVLNKLIKELIQKERFHSK